MSAASGTVMPDSNDIFTDNLLDDTEQSLLTPPPYESQVSVQQPSSPPPPPPPPLRPPPAPVEGSSRLVIAIDYGTTFTGVAFATTQSDHIDLPKIDVTQDWTVKMSNQQKVPSVISYATALQGEAQWGSDIREDAVTMANTKLELQPSASRFEELDLTLHVLKGTGNLAFEHLRSIGSEPEYTCKPPTEVVTDYLRKIFECTRKVISLDQLARTQTAVDIVVTVPVNWSHKAYDSIFKAFRAAGFNKLNFPTLKDTILVTEPEAASYFTARDLQERGTEFLKKDDCFILCDAGGGTVDVISLQVKKTKPFLELEKATAPAGDKCGSSLIDTAFKSWLRDTIGRERYADIDPVNARQQRISPHAAEPSAMRELIKRFNVKKAAFSNLGRSDIKLDLPAPLNKLSIEGRVKEGELVIHHDEMKDIMDTCVNGVIELIKEQIKNVSYGKSRRVKNVFLVGGFGASPYLQEELRQSLQFRKIELRRPDADKSLTAVVQGGVIYGVEKAHHMDAKYMSATTRSYGVLHKNRFEWLVRKGDLVLSNSDTTIESRGFLHNAASCVRGKCEFPIYSYIAQNEDDDDVPNWWLDGQHEVEKVGVVKCDFSGYLDRELRPHPSTLVPGNARAAAPRTKIGELKWRLKLSTTRIDAEILLNGARISHCEIKTELDWPKRGPMTLWHDEEEDDS